MLRQARDAGLVTKCADPADGRVVHVQLTDSGRDYLARRREDRDRAETARAELERAAGDAHAQLSRRADAAVLNPPQDRRLSGRRYSTDW